jgi:hypothetical protein
MTTPSTLTRHRQDRSAWRPGRPLPSWVPLTTRKSTKAEEATASKTTSAMNVAQTILRVSWLLCASMSLRVFRVQSGEKDRVDQRRSATLVAYDTPRRARRQSRQQQSDDHVLSSVSSTPFAYILTSCNYRRIKYCIIEL